MIQGTDGKYDECLVIANVHKSSVNILEIIKTVLLSESLAETQNKQIDFKHGCQSKMFFPTGLVKEGDSLSCKESNSGSPDSYLIVYLPTAQIEEIATQTTETEKTE